MSARWLDEWPAAREAAAQRPGKAFIEGVRQLSYGQLEQLMARVGAWLAANGLGRGSRVVVAIAHDVQLAPVVLAMLRCGVVPLVLNPQASASEAIELLAWTEPDALAADAALIEAWRPALPGPVLRIVPPLAGGLVERLLGRGGDLLPGLPGPAPEPPPAPAGEDLAYVLFTSGSTARPKGVEITHAAWEAHMRTFQRRFGYAPGLRLLNVLALHHTDGLFNGLLAAFASGGTLVRPFGFAVDQLEALEDALHARRITHFVTVPTMLGLMLRFATSPPQRPSDLRMIISSAATLEPPTWEGALARYQVPVVNVYGLTETVCGSLYAGPDPASLRVGTVGAADDCEIRLVGPDGQPAAPGEPGRLWIRGAHLLRGYHRDPAATAEVLREGWFDTGDLASLEPDGLYRLRGRSKQIIITGGYNVSPDEVTAALAAHPAVHEAATLGLPEPTWGEVVVAFVVPARPGVGADELLRHCRERLAPHKVPARIELVEALPRHGPAGKVRFDELRARPAGAPEAAAPAGPDVQATVLALAARCFRARAADLRPDQGPDQLGGWTSLAHLGLVAALERSFGIRLEPRDVMAIKDLRAAVEVVSRKLQARDPGPPPG